MATNPSTVRCEETSPGVEPVSAPGPALVLSARCDHLGIQPRRIDLKRLDELRIGRGPSTVARPTGPRQVQLQVADSWMSMGHARLSRGDGDYWVQDCHSTNGSRLRGRPLLEPERLRDGDVLELGRSYFVFRAAAQSSVPLAVQAESGVDEEFTTCNTELLGQAAALRRVARTDVSILLLGESGTGKEVAARAAHRASGRRGAFVAVNCGALSPQLVESELFGHCKGAFTGAVDAKPGLVAAADGGTLFLDEIADLPLPAQVKLLRVLQEREVLPVGGVRASKVDLRVVSATCKNLEDLVEREQFRADLFSRVRGHTVRLPPLRERLEDLGLLLHTLMQRQGAPGRVELGRPALRALYNYRWPLNIRELGDALKVALALSDGQIVPIEALPEQIRRARPRAAALPAPEESGISREELLRLLEEHRGNLSAIERVVGKSRTTVRNWLRRFGLDPNRFRPQAR